jgi:hydroxymethylglutaryl-CoA reductase (NADPH)
MSSPLTSIFFPLMIFWSLCLAYFFGFFGISFVDKQELSESPSSFGLNRIATENEESEITKQNKTLSKMAKHPSVSSTTTTQKTSITPGDYPICSDRQHPPTSSSRTTKVISDEKEKTTKKVEQTTEEYSNMNDDEVLDQLLSGDMKDYQLEKKLGDYERAVNIRRLLYENILDKKLDLIPYSGYDYNKVFGANCEIVIGYIPIPLGIVGPLTINGENIYIPMATTEGCLVASTNRGCKAISAGGGCCTVVLKDAITRAPCIRMPSAMRAAAVKRWLSVPTNFVAIRDAFNSTTSFGKLESVEATIAGRNVYLRFSCMSGDAMGMNMVSKGFFFFLNC